MRGAPIRMVKINNLTKPRADETTEQLKFLTTVDESRKWYKHFESLTTSHTFKYIPTPNIEILGNSSKEIRLLFNKKCKKKKVTASLFIILSKAWRQPRRPPGGEQARV